MVSCPLTIEFDGIHEIYETPSLLKRPKEESSIFYTWLDSLVSTIVLCLSILGGGSIWSLADYIGNHKLLGFDFNPKKPAQQHILWDSLAVGYILCAVVYGFQFLTERCAKNSSKQLSGKCHIMYTFLILVGTIGCVCSWRGLWSLFDVTTKFIDPPREPDNLLRTCFLAVVLMITFGCFNTSISRGSRRLRFENLGNSLPFNLQMQHPWLEYCCKNKVNNQETYVEFSNIDDHCYENEGSGIQNPQAKYFSI